MTGKLSPLYPAAAGDDNGSQGRAAVAAAVAGDLWSAIGREMWGPWPQADVVVHTGSQVLYSYSYVVWKSEEGRYRGCWDVVLAWT